MSDSRGIGGGALGTSAIGTGRATSTSTPPAEEPYCRRGGIGSGPIGEAPIGAGTCPLPPDEPAVGTSWYPCCCPPRGYGSGVAPSGSSSPWGWDCYLGEYGPLPAMMLLTVSGFSGASSDCDGFNGAWVLTQCASNIAIPLRQCGFLPLGIPLCTWQSEILTPNDFPWSVGFTLEPTPLIHVEVSGVPGAGDAVRFEAAWDPETEGFTFEFKTLDLEPFSGSSACEAPPAVTLSALL